MRSLWLDDSITADYPYFGCFTAPPDVLAASIPRPETPFAPISQRMNQPFIQNVSIIPSTPSSLITNSSPSHEIPRTYTPQPSRTKNIHSKSFDVTLSS